jgi:hypothetical protein
MPRFLVFAILSAIAVSQTQATRGDANQTADNTTTPTTTLTPQNCANPYIEPPAPFGTYQVIAADYDLCAAGEKCKIAVAVGNSGTVSSLSNVSMYYNQWGVNFGR